MSEFLSRLWVHFLISLSGVALAAGAGVSLGILLSRMKKAAPFVIGIIEVIQTIPSLAMLSILFIFFGLGNMTAIMAIFLYSLLPIVQNTCTGILSVEDSLIEAGRGMGMKGYQILARVEIPNAVPVIVSGLRISAITAYGIVTIAVLVGGGGLGHYVYQGAQRGNLKTLFTGAVPISAMAVATDALLNRLERKLSKKQS